MLAVMGVARRAAAEGEFGVAAIALGYCEMQAVPRPGGRGCASGLLRWPLGGHPASSEWCS
jgi:hypothetical protein